VAELSRFDIAEHRGVSMVVIESDLLPPDPAVVVIPLLRGYPSVQRLNPIIEVNGEGLILATRLIASVRRAGLHRTGSAAEQADEITRAVDVLMAGV
jgi:toxin CcdB